MALKFLIVEDLDLARMAAKLILNQLGYEVDVAESGEKGLYLSLQNQYDIIFMDFGLGNTDGAEVTKKIRAQSDQNKETLIIALTAHNEDEYKKKCIEAGMDDFLTKPLNYEKIKYIIDKLPPNK